MTETDPSILRTVDLVSYLDDSDHFSVRDNETIFDSQPLS
jgi:hypothetical protein